MKKLQRLTVTYVADQDRLRLAGALEQQDPVVLWLSRRLLTLMLPELLAWLSLQSSTGEKDLHARQAVSQPRSEEAELLSFRQAASQLNQLPAQTVRAEQPSYEQLVTTLEISRQPQTFTLIFPLLDAEKVAVTFNRTTLAQWLALLYKKTVEAEWGLTVWPDWFCQAQQKRAQDFGVELH
jgi:hypothetical protein